MRKVLTDKFIRSLKQRAGHQRDYFDAIVPGLLLRVTAAGRPTFALLARFPLHPQNSTRRKIADAYIPPTQERKVAAPAVDQRSGELRNGALTLAEARAKARVWLDLIARGKDPAVEADRERIAQQRRQANSFSAVVADYLMGPAKEFAKFADAKTTLEGEFGKRWGARPVTDISPLEVATAIKAIVARGALYQAHNALGYLRAMFNWAIGTGLYGLEASPTERLKPAKLIGKREARSRVLTDTELRQVWQAAEGLGYPYGALLRMLILTGQRVSEVSDMSWSEIDLDKAFWTIPLTRMKSDRAHEVPLAPEALALLMSLPRWTGGDFIFTTTSGAKPVNGFSKCKTRLDRLVAELRAQERAGEEAEPEPQDVLPPWVFHDLRRTVRTHFSALPVQDLVRELVIAHSKPGLHRVYDQYSYASEKRECLRLWEQRLAGILAPKPPADVADLGIARQKRTVHATP